MLRTGSSNLQLNSAKLFLVFVDCATPRNLETVNDAVDDGGRYIVGDCDGMWKLFRSQGR